MPADLATVIAAVHESRRYRHITPTLIARLAEEELPKSKSTAEAEKRTKRRLHQIFGAYATQLPYDKLLGQLQKTRDDQILFKQTCAGILKQHASTAERLTDLENFYAPIFQITGQPASILDLACGLNPLTIPWMELPATAAYTAADIDTEMIRFLNSFLQLIPIRGRAITNDLIAGPPVEEVDVAFLLKTLPCLQHQSKDLLSILDHIRAKWLIISFPTRSLGNRNKGMAATYRGFFEELIRPRGWKAHELLFSSELVFVTDRRT